MKTQDLNKLKGEIKNAILDWCESKVDDLFPKRPQVKAFIKNGINNALVRMDNKINKYLDSFFLFVGDEKGNIDSDTMVDMAVGIFEEMEPNEFKCGMFTMKIDKGELTIDLPNNIMLDLLVGNLGSIRFTASDLKELKNYLN